MSASTADENALLSRVIRAEDADFAPSVANAILKWGFTDQDLDRMKVLAAKARAGTLSSEEQYEAELFSRINNFLGIVKSKARLSLKSQSADRD